MQALKSNVQHIAGIIVGKTLGGGYTKTDRGAKWFSTVSANLAADGVKQAFFPYK